MRKKYSFRQKTLDDYRQKFKFSPVGTWRWASGTFGVVMDEIWEFHPNHTGRIQHTGAFGGIQGETLFEWKEVAIRTIACRVTKEPESDSDDEDEDNIDEEQESGPDPWVTVRYDFTMVPTDVGDIIGMVQVATDGTLNQFFWQSLDPLSYCDSW